MSKEAIGKIRETEAQAQELIARAEAECKKARLEAEEKILILRREFSEDVKIMIDNEMKTVRSQFESRLKEEEKNADKLKNAQLEKYKSAEERLSADIIRIITD